MFYVEVQNKQHVVIVPEGTINSVAIDDDIKNYDRYYYDEGTERIVKRDIVDYEISEEDGTVLIAFNTDDYLPVTVSFRSEINEIVSVISAYNSLESIKGKATLRLTTLLSGDIYIEPSDNNSYFDTIMIESTERIDNEYNPSISVKGNEFNIEPSVDYNRFRTLQQELNSLRKRFDEFEMAGMK